MPAPIKAQAFTFYVGLRSQANSTILQATPTLAAGDATITKDGGAAANLATLPDVLPAAGKRVRVQLSATEMDADNVVVVFSDAAGAEWMDLLVNISTDSNPAGIKKNTQLANFGFRMRDSADHITPKTGLTVAVQRGIDGAAFADATNTPATEVSAGWYKITLSAADLNGDVIALKFTAAGADQLDMTIITEP